MKLLIDYISRSKARILATGLAILLLSAVLFGAVVQDRVHVFSVSVNASSLSEGTYDAHVRARAAWVDLFIVQSGKELVSVSIDFPPGASAAMQNNLRQAAMARLSDIRISSSAASLYYRALLISLEYLLPVAAMGIVVFLLLRHQAKKCC